MATELLRVEHLAKTFKIKTGWRGKPCRVDAVNEVSLSVLKGETLGIVGESGCGKSTMGKIIVGLTPPTSGRVYLQGECVVPARGAGRRARKQMQMVFQNPYASLDPKMTLGQILEEPLKINRCPPEARQKRVAELLEYVGFSPSFLGRHPREFSGGQRQRIAIARALAVNPALLVLDEPVSALDVSIQAQIMNLLVDLQRELDLTYIFVSHDLGVIEYVSDRVAVMYLGQLVELADCRSLYDLQLHPYTRLLIQSVPVPDPRRKHDLSLAAPVALQASSRLPGCQFQNRCPEVKEICRTVEPGLIEYKKGHLVACHLYQGAR